MRITLIVETPKGSKLLDAATYIRAIEEAQSKVGTGVLQDYKKTVETWDHKPVFYSTRRGNILYIGTKDAIYGFVDLGTEPHEIRAKNVPRLAFFSRGFKPKSRVGYIASYAGRRADSGFTRPISVHHPGTKARNFSQKIQEKWQKEFTKLARKAVKDAAMKAPKK